MSCTILTPERWEQFLKNGLTKEETSELIAHLGSACPDCDQFFSRIRGSTDRELRQMFNDIPEDELDFIKKSTSTRIIQKRPLSEIPDDNIQPDKIIPQKDSPKRGLLTVLPGGGPFGPALAGGVAVFALLAVGLLVQLQIEDVPQQTAKGISAPAIGSLNLQFATGHRLNDEFIVERGINGGRYARDDTLYLHYELPVKGYVYLIGYQGRGNMDMLYPNSPDRIIKQDAGEYSIPSEDAANKGIPLSNVHGRYVVIGIYSPDSIEFDKRIRPVLEQSVDVATGSVDQQKMESLGKDIVVDVVYFDVQT